MPVLELEDAAVERDGRAIWRDAQLAVEAGEFVAVLGPNGSGKSTLLKVFLGELALVHGTARVLDGPPGGHNAEIGYLPQRHGFDEAVRIRGADLVRLGLDGHRFGVSLPWGDGERRARVAEALDVVGGAAYAKRPIGELSGGEQQRLLIAQALVGRPELLLLDEPLDGLDLPNQAAVAALVARISRTRGVTVLLVAHDVNPLLPHVDRVVYVAGGRVLSGTPQEVIRSETLSALYGVPVEVLRAHDGRLVVVGEPEAPPHHHDRHAHP